MRLPCSPLSRTSLVPGLGIQDCKVLGVRKVPNSTCTVTALESSDKLSAVQSLAYEADSQRTVDSLVVCLVDKLVVGTDLQRTHRRIDGDQIYCLKPGLSSERFGLVGRPQQMSARRAENAEWTVSHVRWSKHCQLSHTLAVRRPLGPYSTETCHVLGAGIGKSHVQKSDGRVGGECGAGRLVASKMVCCCPGVCTATRSMPEDLDSHHAQNRLLRCCPKPGPEN